MFIKNRSRPTSTLRKSSIWSL